MTTQTKSATAATEVCDQLNSLLRGELSAVETYEQAMPNFSGTTLTELLEIHSHHAKSVAKLTNHVRHYGGEPTTSSGAWGSFAKVVTGTAKLIGADTVLATLNEGEEHGVGIYESILKKETLPDECIKLVSDDLLPLCREHIRKLTVLREVKN